MAYGTIRISVCEVQSSRPHRVRRLYATVIHWARLSFSPIDVPWFDQSTCSSVLTCQSTGIARKSCQIRRDRPEIWGIKPLRQWSDRYPNPAPSVPLYSATDLEQQVSAPSRPSHFLLRLVHAPVDQEVRCALGDRRSDPQTGTVPFGIVDQPRGLTSECLFAVRSPTRC
jgi:hypothetical protein